MDKDYISNLTDIIYQTPIWVQESVLLDIMNHIDKSYTNIKFSYSESDIYPAYVPKLSFKGKKELNDREHALEPNIYKCFSAINDGKRVIDITLNNFWTLEETSNYIAFGIENEYIIPPENIATYAAILYIGSKIRLGEYIKRLKKIDIVQLDDVLRKQKNYNIENPDAKKKIGEVLVDMGYIAQNDIEVILALKADSQRRCIVQNVSENNTVKSSFSNEELIAQINKLKQENNLLKDKLRAIFNIQNKNK